MKGCAEALFELTFILLVFFGSAACLIAISVAVNVVQAVAVAK